MRGEKPSFIPASFFTRCLLRISGAGLLARAAYLRCCRPSRGGGFCARRPSLPSGRFLGDTGRPFVGCICIPSVFCIVQPRLMSKGSAYTDTPVNMCKHARAGDMHAGVLVSSVFCTSALWTMPASKECCQLCSMPTLNTSLSLLNDAGSHARTFHLT